MGALYGCSELLLALTKRAKNHANARDRGSLWVLWVVIILSMNLAALVSSFVPQAALPASLYGYGFALFVLGLGLRWYAIVHLGKFFTVNVAISDDHRVVSSGPYRLIRHPAYSGALLAFYGLGLCFQNSLSLLIAVVPITAAFLHRIKVEEAALNSSLGANYRDYASRTKRIIPFIY